MAIYASRLANTRYFASPLNPRASPASPCHLNFSRFLRSMVQIISPSTRSGGDSFHKSAFACAVNNPCNALSSFMLLHDLVVERRELAVDHLRGARVAHSTRSGTASRRWRGATSRLARRLSTRTRGRSTRSNCLKLDKETSHDLVDGHDGTPRALRPATGRSGSSRPTPKRPPRSEFLERVVNKWMAAPRYWRRSR